MRLTTKLSAVTLVGGCTRPETSAAEAQRPAPARRTATLDSAQARRLCANADSVIAAGRACEIRDQRAPFRTFP